MKMLWHLYTSTCVKLPPGDNVISQTDYDRAIEGYRASKGDGTRYHDTLIWLSMAHGGKLFKWNEHWITTDGDEREYCVVFYNGLSEVYNAEQFIDFLTLRLGSHWDDSYKFYMFKLQCRREDDDEHVHHHD